MAKITEQDTVEDAIIKMSEGNPGAISAMAQLLKKTGGVAFLTALDNLETYGPRIWMLYKDVCGQDIVKTMGVLAACEENMISEEEYNHAIDNYGDGLDVDEVMDRVVEKGLETLYNG